MLQIGSPTHGVTAEWAFASGRLIETVYGGYAQQIGHVDRDTQFVHDSDPVYSNAVRREQHQASPDPEIVYEHGVGTNLGTCDGAGVRGGISYDMSKPLAKLHAWTPPELFIHQGDSASNNNVIRIFTNNAATSLTFGATIYRVGGAGMAGTGFSTQTFQDARFAVTDMNTFGFRYDWDSAANEVTFWMEINNIMVLTETVSTTGTMECPGSVMRLVFLDENAYSAVRNIRAYASPMPLNVAPMLVNVPLDEPSFGLVNTEDPSKNATMIPGEHAFLFTKADGSHLNPPVGLTPLDGVDEFLQNTQSPQFLGFDLRGEEYFTCVGGFITQAAFSFDYQVTKVGQDLLIGNTRGLAYISWGNSITSAATMTLYFGIDFATSSVRVRCQIAGHFASVDLDFTTHNPWKRNRYGCAAFETSFPGTGSPRLYVVVNNVAVTDSAGAGLATNMQCGDDASNIAKPLEQRDSVALQPTYTWREADAFAGVFTHLRVYKTVIPITTSTLSDPFGDHRVSVEFPLFSDFAKVNDGGGNVNDLYVPSYIANAELRSNAVVFRDGVETASSVLGPYMQNREIDKAHVPGEPNGLRLRTPMQYNYLEMEISNFSQHPFACTGTDPATSILDRAQMEVHFSRGQVTGGTAIVIEAFNKHHPSGGIHMKGSVTYASTNLNAVATMRTITGGMQTSQSVNSPHLDQGTINEETIRYARFTFERQSQSWRAAIFTNLGNINPGVTSFGTLTEYPPCPTHIRLRISSQQYMEKATINTYQLGSGNNWSVMTPITQQWSFATSHYISNHASLPSLGFLPAHHYRMLPNDVFLAHGNERTSVFRDIPSGGVKHVGVGGQIAFGNHTIGSCGKVHGTWGLTPQPTAYGTLRFRASAETPYNSTVEVTSRPPGWLYPSMTFTLEFHDMSSVTMRIKLTRLSGTRHHGVSKTFTDIDIGEDNAFEWHYSVTVGKSTYLQGLSLELWATVNGVYSNLGSTNVGAANNDALQLSDPWECESEDMRVTFDKAGVTLRALESWASVSTLEPRSHLFTYGLDSDYSEEFDRAPDGVPSGDFEFDAEILCEGGGGGGGGTLLFPPAGLPTQPNVPVLPAEQNFPGEISPGPRKFYIQSAPTFGTLYNTLDGITPTTPILLSFPSETDSNKVLVKVDGEIVGDKSGIFRYSAYDQGISLNSLNMAFACFDLDDQDTDVAPFAASPKFSPLSSLDALLTGSGQEGTIVVAGDTDYGHALALWLRLSGDLDLTGQKVYMVGSGTTASPYNMLFGYLYNQETGKHWLFIEYSGGCTQLLVEFSLGVGIGDASWHPVRVISYMAPEVTGRRDLFTVVLVDGVRDRTFEATKLGNPLPDGCQIFPTMFGNIHQYVSVNRRYGDSTSNNAFALDDIAILRIPDFSSVQTIINNPVLTTWVIHPLLVRYIRVLSTDTMTTLQDVANTVNVVPGPYLLGDPDNDFDALIIAGNVLLGTISSVPLPVNGTITTLNPGPGTLVLRVESLPTSGTLTDKLTGAPLGIGNEATSLEVVYSTPLSASVPFIDSFRYRIVRGPDVSINEATISISVQTEFSPESPNIYSQKCLSGIANNTIHAEASPPKAAPGGVVMSLWFRGNNTLEPNDQGCLMETGSDGNGVHIALCYHDPSGTGLHYLELRVYNVFGLVDRVNLISLYNLQHPTAWQYFVLMHVSDMDEGGGWTIQFQHNGALSPVFPIFSGPTSVDSIRAGGSKTGDPNEEFCIEGIMVHTLAVNDTTAIVNHEALNRWNEDGAVSSGVGVYWLFGEDPTGVTIPDLSGNGHFVVADNFTVEDSSQVLTSIVAIPLNLTVNEDESALMVLDFTKEGSRVGVFPFILTLPQNGVLYQSPDGVSLGAQVVANGTLFENQFAIYVPAPNFNGLDWFAFSMYYNLTSIVSGDSAITTLNVLPSNDPFSLDVTPLSFTQTEDFTPEFTVNIIPSLVIDVDLSLEGGLFASYVIDSAVVRCVQTLTCPSVMNRTGCMDPNPHCTWNGTNCGHQCVQLPDLVTPIIPAGLQDVQIASVANRNNPGYQVFIDYVVRALFDNQSVMGTFEVIVTPVNDPFTVEGIAPEPVLQEGDPQLSYNVVEGLISDPDLVNEGDTHRIVDGSPVLSLLSGNAVTLGSAFTFETVFPELLFFTPGIMDGQVEATYDIRDSADNSYSTSTVFNVTSTNSPITGHAPVGDINVNEDAELAIYPVIGTVFDFDLPNDNHTIVNTTVTECETLSGDAFGHLKDIVAVTRPESGLMDAITFKPVGNTWGQCRVNFTIKDDSDFQPSYYNTSVTFNVLSQPDDFILASPPGQVGVEDNFTPVVFNWMDGCAVYPSPTSCVFDADLYNGGDTHVISGTLVDPSFKGNVFVASNEIRFTGVPNASGLVTIHYNVTDSGGFTHGQNVTVNIANAPDPVSLPPVFDALVQEGGFDYVDRVGFNNTAAIDADFPPLGPGEVLTITILSVSTISGACSGSASVIGLDNNIVRFTPTSNLNAGVCEITFRVTDSTANFDDNSFRVNIQPFNDPFTLDPFMAEFNQYFGSALVYPIVGVQDPDFEQGGDSHRILMLNNVFDLNNPTQPCPGMNITKSSDITISVVELGAPGTSGVCNVTYTVADQGIPPNTLVLTGSATLLDANDPPSIGTPYPIFTGMEDGFTDVDVVTSFIVDPDSGSSHAVSVIGQTTLIGSVTASISVLPDQHTIRMVYAADTNGRLRVDFRVTDNAAATLDSFFTVDVNGTQDDFTLAPPGRTEVDADASDVAIDVISSGLMQDPDLILGHYPTEETTNITVLSLKIDGSLTGTVSVSGNSVVFELTSNDQEGVANILYEVTDGAFNVHNATLEVEAIKLEEPVLLSIPVISGIVAAGVAGLVLILAIGISIWWLISKRKGGGSLLINARAATYKSPGVRRPRYKTLSGSKNV